MSISLRAVLISLAIVLACDSAGSHAERQRAPSPSRRLIAVPTDSLWVRGGRQDRVLSYPEYLAHDARQLYVTDNATHQVLAFAQTTGALAWTSATTGAQLRQPSSITGLPSGGLAALDGGTLTVVDSQGKLKTTATLVDGELARQVCALSDSTFLVAFFRQHLPLVVMNAAGQPLRRLELPWASLRALDPMQTQLLLAGGSAHRCIVSLVFGEGLASIKDGQVEWTAPYVESVEIAPLNIKHSNEGQSQTTVERIGAKHPAVRDVTADDSVVAVIFEGAVRQPGSLVDEYDARTGAYLRTRTFDRRVMGIQESKGHVFILAGLQGYPALIAMPLRDRAR